MFARELFLFLNTCLSLLVAEILVRAGIAGTGTDNQT